MKNKILGITSAIILVLSLFAANTIFAKGKYTLMYVYMDPCRMCHDFEKRVLSDPTVKEELTKFNFKKVNANRTRVEGVRLTPTVIIYNDKNEQVRKWLPSLDRGEFLEIIRQYE